MAQPGEEIVTLRYFKIKKGSFDEFLRVSVEGVWPYFEKLGSRVIGMWKVITPAGVDGAPSAENKDFDEVYLSTRYASLEHWKASREGVLHGGNGPDWVKCKGALDRRAALTISTNVIFLKGRMAPGGPYYNRKCAPCFSNRHRVSSFRMVCCNGGLSSSLALAEHG